MNNIQRTLNSKEIERVKNIINDFENVVNRSLNWKGIFTLFLLTVLSAIHIFHYDKSNWSLISKLLVVSCPIGIWVILEQKYKGRKKRIDEINKLKEFEKGKPINIIKVQAKRVMEFEEKDDEGILYLIEPTEGNSFYLWNDQWLIPEDLIFPCSEFEIYLDETVKFALERKVNCKGQKIKTIKISSNEKWKYFGRKGFPGDLEKEEKRIEEIETEIKTIKH